MKQIIFLFSCFFIISGSLFAQGGDKMNFQMIVRDSGGQQLVNSSIGLRFKILQDTETGTVVFEETHTTTTNSIGMVSVKIGAGSPVIGTISAIDWTTGLYFISAEIDPLGGMSYTLQQTTELNSIPFASSVSKTSSAATLNYNSLTNKPETITGAETSKIDFIDVTNAIDLNATKIAVDLNTSKAFPGFGTTSGTVFEVLWSKMGNNSFFTTGTVGMGTNVNLGTSAASLIVEGGIVIPVNASTTAEIGSLDYLNLNPNTNDFYYGDNFGNLKLYRGIADLVFSNTNANILGKLGIGNGMVTNYNFNDNSFVIVSPSPSILFEDTSSSSSFPSGDWRIRINDLADGGDDFFSIENVNAAVSNFKIMAEAPTHSFSLLANGNLGFLTETPTETLEVTNAINATSFVGDASNLTNVAFSGTASTSNTGSTTIGADTNEDSTGAIIFETQNQNRMSLLSNGGVAIGAITPTANLEVDGDVKLQDFEANTLRLSGTFKKAISVEPAPGNFQPIDILDKSIIIYNSGSGSYLNFSNGKDGQVFTIINSGTGTLTFLNFSNILATSDIIIPPNGSISFVQNGFQSIVTGIVN